MKSYFENISRERQLYQKLLLILIGSYDRDKSD